MERNKSSLGKQASCVSNREPASPPPRDGCCADGGRCDDVCIAAAAAYLARKSRDQHLLYDSCCKTPTDDKCRIEPTGDCCAGPGESCVVVEDSMEPEKTACCAESNQPSCNDIQDGCCTEISTEAHADTMDDSCTKPKEGCCSKLVDDRSKPKDECRPKLNDDCCSKPKDDCCSKPKDDCSKPEDVCFKPKDDCCSKSKDDCCSPKDDCCSKPKYDCCSEPKGDCDTNLKSSYGNGEVNDDRYVEVEDDCCVTEEEEEDCCSKPEEDYCSKPKDVCYKPTDSCCSVPKDDCCSKQMDGCGVQPEEGSCKKPTRDSCCGAAEVGETCATDDSAIDDEYFTRADDLDSVMQKLTALLEAGLCICRNVMKNAGSCCDQERRSATCEQQTRRNRPCNGQSKSRLQPKATDTGGRGLKKSACPGSATVGKSSSGPQMETKKSAMAQEIEVTPSERFSKVKTGDPDLENKIECEQVLFSVSGMTCTGCVKKVLGVFGRIPGTDSVSVNYVAGRGECYVDTKAISVEQVLRQLRSETGFQIARIMSSALSLDLLMTKEQAQILNNASIAGINSVECLEKGLYRVSFDPSLVGARTVLSKSNGHLAPPGKSNVQMEGRKAWIVKLWRLAAAAAMTIPVVVLKWATLPISHNATSITSLVLGTGVQIVSIPEFYIPAIKALVFSRSIEMDMLVVISITAAYCYSVVAFGLVQAGISIKEKAFFETSSLLITLVLLGRLISAYAKIRAVNAVSMKSLQAEYAYLEPPEAHINGSDSVEIDARLLELDDLIRVPAHSRVVTDGEIIHGTSAVDESMITGESSPVHKGLGDAVIAGTINGSGILQVRATRLPGQNSITDIADLVADALGNKPRIQSLADMIAGRFVPVVFVTSLVVLVVWLAVAVKARNENAGGAIGTAITYAIAVLAISCPCALGLAVPLVLVIAGGIAAKSGVVIKSADATESSFRVTDVVFDKTGTLTRGDLHVVREELSPGTCKVTKEVALSLALSLVQDNEHPVSRAVASHLQAQDVSPVLVSHIVSVPGAGIEARYGHSVAKAGNPAWLKISSSPVVAGMQSQGLTLLCVTVEGRLAATFGIQATTRPEAPSTLAVLKARGIRCHIVSGDNDSAVHLIARALGVPEARVMAQSKPGDKQNYIRALQMDTHTKRKVLFVGDGTNDAAAIAQADVGLQIGDTSDISRAVADVVLLGGLDGITTLLDISKAAFRRIAFNFVWSGVYNFFAILLASGAFVKFRIPPAYAGLGEIVSVLPVVVVALSMTWTSVRRGALVGAETEKVRV